MILRRLHLYRHVSIRTSIRTLNHVSPWIPTDWDQVNIEVGTPMPFANDGPRCLFFADDSISLDEDMRGNGRPAWSLYRPQAGGEVVDRDNAPRRLSLRVMSEGRGADENIPLAL
jgi:hypothetical protein